MSSLTVGKYIAIAKSAEHGQLNNDKQTPYVEILFEVIEGEQKGATMSQRFFLSPNARTYTIDNLNNCGCTFPGGDIFSLEGLGTKRVEIVVQKQKPKPGETESKYHEIRFVNDPDGPRGAPPKPLDDARKAALREEMRGAVLAKQPQGAPAATGKAPFMRLDGRVF